MGHMNVTENLLPLPERKGCGALPYGKGHDVYNFDCFDCFLYNGGGND
jgi:hypothetical protein